MTIPFTNLFTLLGHNGNILNTINTERGTTIPNDMNTMYSAYESDNVESVIDGTMAQITSWQNANSGFLYLLQQLASNTIITIVNNDVTQPNASISTALNELIVQMKANSQTVAQSVVGISGTAAGTNEGNPAFVYSTKTSLGVPLENMYAELIVGACTSDSQPNGGASAGSEVITFQGQQAVTDTLSYKWPGGSGSSLALTLVNASLSSTGGTSQWLNNGDFESWTTNVPNNWEIVVGTAGTQIVKESVAYTGTYSLGIVGDGSTLTSIHQEFAVDNSGTIAPVTQYCWNAWIKVSATGGTGVLQVDLVDGTGTIINDQAGTANSTTINVSSLTTSFVAFGGSFRTPRLLPTSVYLRISLTTALTAGKIIYIDRMAFTQMTQMYTGGPYMVGFSGNTDSIIGDSFTVTTTNTPGGFQRLFDRWFNMKSLQMLLPSTTGTPTLPDSLIA